MNNLAEILSGDPQEQGFATLKARIDRLAERQGAEGGSPRAIADKSTREKMESLLGEVDETVLARVLIVTISGRGSLSLSVSGRRIMAISGRDAPECTKPKPVWAYLKAFVEQAGRIEICSGKSDSDFTRLGNGVSVAALVGVTQNDKPEFCQTDPVPAFFNELKGQMVAWVTLDAHARRLNRGGEANWASRLARLVETDLAELESQRRQAQASGNREGCVMLNLGGNDGVTLIYARAETSGFVALLPAGMVREIQAAWMALGP